MLYKSEAYPDFNVTSSRNNDEADVAKMYSTYALGAAEDLKFANANKITIATLHGQSRECLPSATDTRAGMEKRRCSNSDESIFFTDAEFDLVAAECMVYPCLRSYNATVVNGTLEEQIVSSTPAVNIYNALRGEGRRNNTDAFYEIVKRCLVDVKWYDKLNRTGAMRDRNWGSWQERGGTTGAPRHCLRALDYYTSKVIMAFLRFMLRGSCTLLNSAGRSHNGKGKPVTADEMVLACDNNKSWIRELHGSGNASFENISNAIDSMKTALTSYMRLGGEDWEGTSSGFVSRPRSAYRLTGFGWPIPQHYSSLPQFCSRQRVSRVAGPGNDSQSGSRPSSLSCFTTSRWTRGRGMGRKKAGRSRCRSCS